MALIDSAGVTRWDSAGRRGAPQRSRVKPLDWLLTALPLLVVFIQLILLGANSGVLSAAAVLTDVLALVVLLSANAVRNGVGTMTRVMPVLVLVAAAAVWGGFASITSITPSAAPLEIAKLMGATALLMCGVVVGERRTRSRLFCGLLAAAGGLYAVGAFWAYEADPFRVMGVVKVTHAWRFTGTLLNANVAGVVFGAICLTSLGWVQSLLARRRASKAAPIYLTTGLATALVALVACGFTASRAAFLTTVALVALLWLSGAFAAKGDARRGGPVRIITAVAVLTLLVLAFALGLSKVLFRYEDPGETFQGRLQAIGHFTALAEQRPIMGWGLGAFEQVNQSNLQSASAVNLSSFGAAHSSIVQAMLEGGIPYLFLLIAAGAFIIIQVAANWGKMADGWSRGLVAAIALAVFCSFEDIDLNVPAVVGLTALMLGVLWGRAIGVRARGDTEAAA